LGDGEVAEIRLFSVPIFPSPEHLNDLPEGKWEQASAKSLAQFSASAWFFAKRLHRDLGIPIGIIHSSWGGTSILTWTNEEALDDFKDSMQLKPLTDRYDEAIWKEKVTASIENHRIRRNAISYPDAEVRQQILSTNGNQVNWKKINLPDEQLDLGYVSWLQKDVLQEENQVSGGLTLHLGFLNRQSHVYWNGAPLGYFQYPAPLIVNVPDSLIKVGRNTITVRVASPWGSAKIQGKSEGFFSLKSSIQEPILPLSGEWKLLENAEVIPDALPSYVNLPSFLFNGMVAPVIPYGIKGFIWDQGSADASRPFLYEALFKRLINDWRKFWQNYQLPFLFVQNTGTYTSHHFEERTFTRSYLREAQEKALDLPKTGMVVSLDIGDPYDVHPKNKQDFGNRLALQALKKVYGKDIIADGPFFGTCEVRGKTLVVQAKDQKQELVLKLKNEHTGFEIAGPSGKFYPANASLKENKLYISSTDIAQPKILRYAWGENPDTSVFNKEGLPMAPFRIKVDTE
jgi:sialate O-acetylesterase